MTEPKAKEIKDRILIKIRNPYNNQYIQKSFRYDLYASKEIAEQEAQKWKEETLALLKEKNQLMGNTQPITTGSDAKKKLSKQVEQMRTKNANLNSDQSQIQPQEQNPVKTLDTYQRPVHSMINIERVNQLQKKPFPYDKWIPQNTGASLVLVSKSKGGKTNFLKKIISKMPKDVIAVVITPNFQNEVYDAMKRRAVFSPIFDSSIVKLCQKINQKTKNHYKFLICLDDIIDQKNNSSVLKTFLTLRNANISVILSVQSTMLVNKLVRNNANYVLLGKLQGEEAIKDAYQKFLSNYASDLAVKKQDEIYKIYNDLTDDFNFILVNNLKERIYQTNKSL